MKISVSHLVYPVSYVALETLLVVSIKLTSIDGKTSYNPVTVNLVAELLKLSIALNASYADGSLQSMLDNMNIWLFGAFLIPNLLYAINNNLYHYSIGLLPPAIYIVAINSLRTILTALLQPCVSNIALNRYQIIACALLVCSFFFASTNELVEAIFSNSSRASVFVSLLILSTIFSALSVTASLSQEKLLKDCKTVMSANVINYSIGATFQFMGLLYSKYNAPEQSLSRGFDSVYVQLIPFMMAASGLTISLVLRYYDNIVKLICSSISVLLVNSITSYFAGLGLFNLAFFIGWCLTVPATFLYTYTPSSTVSLHKVDSTALKAESKVIAQIDKKTKRTYVFEKIFGAAFVVFFSISLSYSYSVVKSPVSLALTNIVEPLCHISAHNANPNEIPQNLRFVEVLTEKNGPQFISVSEIDGILHSSCPSKLFIVGPSTQSYMKATQGVDEWRQIEEYSSTTSESPSVLPWEVVEKYVSSAEPYFWVLCDVYADANLIVRPFTVFRNNSFAQKELPVDDSNQVFAYIEELSRASSQQTPSATESSTPLFDTVIVLYFDAVSRIKFQHSYPKSSELFDGLNADSLSSHASFSLEKLHSLGINSHPNYMSFFAGECTPKGFSRDAYRRKSKNSKRYPWLIDLAEKMGYDTISGLTGCQSSCTGTCYESFMDGVVEEGGYMMQYMAESDNRLPTKDIFPNPVFCEHTFRSSLLGKECRTCASDWTDVQKGSQKRMWLGNKLGLSYVFDWFRTWLSLRKVIQPKGKRFGAFVFEETHFRDQFQSIDTELRDFVHDLVYTPSKYNTGNAAILILSDHGIHHSEEFHTPPGLFANKLPFGNILLPKTYLSSHPDELRRLTDNAKRLITPFDLRATVQYWLTGREWSAVKGRHVSSTASNFGKSLMTTEIESDRNCQMAGIPSFFCGCNMVPCSTKAANLVKTEKAQIIEFINKKLSLSSPQTLPVCRPLDFNDFIHISDSKTSCYEKPGYIQTDIYLSRNRYKLSVIFRRYENALVVENVNTVSLYGSHWEVCKEKLQKANIFNNITMDLFQFCYCEEEESFLISSLSILLNVLN